MLKHVMMIVCMVVVAGCSSNNAGVKPVNTNVEAPKVEAPKAEVSKAEAPRVDIPVPQKAIVPVEQPKTTIPTTLNFKRNVTFNHKLHSDTFSCIKCHKDRPGKIANFGKDYAHETCKGCHKEQGKSVSCNTCHRD